MLGLVWDFIRVMLVCFRGDNLEFFYLFLFCGLFVGLLKFLLFVCYKCDWFIVVLLVNGNCSLLVSFWKCYLLSVLFLMVFV